MNRFTLISCWLTAAVVLSSCQHFQRKPSTTSNAPLGREVSIPSSKGLVWLPLAWTIRIAPGGDNEKKRGLDAIQLENLGIVFRNLKSKQETFVQMKDRSGELSAATLDEKGPTRTLYLPSSFEMPAGEYALEGFRANHVDLVTKKSIPLEIPLKNPFQTTGKPPIQIVVREGRIAAAMRIAAQTILSVKDTNLQALTEVEPIDREVVPIDIALAQLGRTSTSGPLVHSASPDLPRSRQSLTSPDGEPHPFDDAVARVGMLLDVPCTMTGTLKLVWKRTSDDREYFSLIPLAQVQEDTKSECQKTRLIASSLELPAGNWILKSNYIWTQRSPVPNFRLPTLKSPDDYTQKYFSLGEANTVFMNLHLEREIERQFVTRLDEKNSTTAYVPGRMGWRSSVLYLGRFELVPKGNLKEGIFESWDTLFRRSYALVELKEKFKASDIYSAYTLDALERDRSKGTAIRSVLKVSSASADAKKIEPLSTEFRKSATEQLAECVKEREELDPLVNVSGTLSFSALRAANGINVKSFAFDGHGASDKWVEECFQKKILSFRFSQRVPSSFQGEMKFSSE